jgi:hypothetical protein
MQLECDLNEFEVEAQRLLRYFLGLTTVPWPVPDARSPRRSAPDRQSGAKEAVAELPR